ncbi:MAG: AfsR/SARP family transcriptional regulator [Nocardiopsaceae bacterium]|nr:AfsR/SARP family transcriptional regulator [Nocardiopsaceae bacterium]
MRYEVLGPVRLIHDDRIVHVNARKIGTLLVILVSNAGRVVSIDQIITEIWGDAVPRRAVAGVHVYVSQVRKMFGQLGADGDRLRTSPPGYVLRLDDGGADEVDAHAFLRRASAGRDHFAGERYEEAERTLSGALGCWHGPLEWARDCGPGAGAFATLLTETRLEATELLIDTQMRLGRHREVVGQLHSLVAEHPLRENFYQQLMLALYRSGRRADALRAYQDARRTLLDELGLEPCRGLQRLQHAILAADERVLNGHGALTGAVPGALARAWPGRGAPESSVKATVQC